MKKDVKLVFEDSKILEIYRNTTVREVLKELNDNNIIALRINGSAVCADYEITEDAFVNYITVSEPTGQKIYMQGLKYVYITAIKSIYGSNSLIHIKHSLDKGLYTEIDIGKKIDKYSIQRIKNRMKEICNKDISIKQINVSKDDAYEYARSLNETEKMLNFTYMTNDSATLYELEDEYNYFYNIMPPSTGYLKRFDVVHINGNGIMLCYPINNIVPKYIPTPKVLDSFRDYETKLNNIGARYSGDINKLIIDGKISDFIQSNEILYDQNMENIAQTAIDKNIRAIFISGPSSSGKTTTSKKLALQLKAKGKDTLVISTDDYFLERCESPKKADGSYEFEIVTALDIKLFQDQMRKLLAGEEVIIPTFNFITGEKEYKRKPTTLNKNQILIVEGLHAINERLNSSIPKKSKLKIYISPFTPISLDRHNHISTTDIRFLRRMVRDNMHRGYSAESTLTNWMGMRKSEEMYVYPYQREADIILNTSLAYEIGVIRTYAEPLLYSIGKESPYYEEAIRILRFLKIFMCIPNDFVPNVSVLREFIGNSYFE